MIRFLAHDPNGKTIVGLGITAANVKRLQNGEPIFVKAESVGLTSPDIAIFYGETLEGLNEQLKPMLGPNTKITVDPLLEAGMPEDVRTKPEGQNKGRA